MQYRPTNPLHFFLGIVLLLLPSFAFAHAPEQSYIYLHVHKDHVEGNIQITTRDLNTALGLNLRPDLSTEDLDPYLPRIYEYVLQRVAFSYEDRELPVRFTEPTLLVLDLGTFVKLHFKFDEMKEVPDYLDIEYNILFEKDSKHRGILVQGYNWKAGIINNESLISLIFSPSNNQQRLSLTEGSVLNGFWAMVKLGIWHIWIGLDHILFLLALILPSVVRRQKQQVSTSGRVSSARWAPVKRFRPAFIYIIKIVTFFTIAHSITLALAALGVINLPSRLVESIIALSIALAAYHNIQPVFRSKEWIIAFGFGLFHGFGFASVLAEKGLSGEYMVLSLFGFNVGVEIGQVFIICLIFPFLFLLRRSSLYPKILTYGSIVLILISLYWATERMFDIDLPAGAYVNQVLRSIGL